jgi:hypothetical protein
MTLLDGQGRTPHDTYLLSGAVMVCCLPYLCVVACTKFLSIFVKKAQFDGTKNEDKD